MPFCFLLKPKTTLFYLLSFAATSCILRCHSLSLVVLFVVTRSTTCCHAFYHSLPLVMSLVTRCITRLSFQKRSTITAVNITNNCLDHLSKIFQSYLRKNLLLSTDNTQMSFQIFYAISCYFSENLTEVAIGRKICKWLYCNLRKE